MVDDLAVDQALDRIVKTLLRVARLGETDRRGWWATQSFGAPGRVVLKPRLPRTWRMAAAELDLAAAGNRHREIIDRLNAVHLFSDNWPVRRWTTAWLAEQKTAVEPSGFFEELESAPMTDLENALSGPDQPVEVTGRAVRIGSVARSDLESPIALVEHVVVLGSVYPQLGQDFAVPYLEVVE